jgi:hypothetical protein
LEAIIMGVRGPVPKRTSQRLGHMTKAQKAESTSIQVTGAIEVPPPDDSWHPAAVEWYLSLQDSGQSKQFEPSDWAAARLVAAEMTRMLADAPNGALFRVLWSAMGDLLTTEGARRRVKVEIDRRALSSSPAAVASIADYRAL